MRKRRIGTWSVLGLLLAGGASAVPVTVYDDLDLSGDYTAGEEVTGGTNGTGGRTYSWAFDLDAATQDLASTAIQIVMTTYDHNWEISVNGVVIVPVDPGNPAVFSPAVQTPWNANSNALPRLVMDIGSSAIDFAGSLTTGAASMTTGLVYNQPLVLPVFQDGQNTIVIVNPDDVGPDGIDFSISADVGPLPVPEPRTAGMLLLGLAALAVRARRR
ncbi:MAG: PEP-CTERM sorting domain-containing protein [Myxococcota bacterium]